MSERKGQDWFENNFTAVPGGIVGNCSACVFRNAPKYCNKMICTYVDLSGDSDVIESVYWVARETHANVGEWTELREFFDKVPKNRVRVISNDIMTRAVLSELSKAR